MRLRDADPQYDGGMSAFARISMDFAVAGDKWVPATNRTSYNTNGTIAGTLNMGSDDCDMEHISVLVNGANYKVPVQGCTFYLDKLSPGIYRIGLDGEFLPIEIVPESKSYVVEVAASSVTRIDFNLQAEYSAAGQVLKADGQPLTNVRVSLYDGDGEKMMDTLSDQFGYYRVDGLTPGDYEVRVEGRRGQALASRRFTIENDFLFGLELKLPSNLPLQ